MLNPFKDRIEEGMEVRSVDGDKLGRVVAIQGDSFMIEKGFFFPKDYVVAFADVAEIQEGTIYLAFTKEHLREGGSLLDQARSRLDEVDVGERDTLPQAGVGPEDRRTVAEIEPRGELRRLDEERAKQTQAQAQEPLRRTGS